MDMKDCIDVRKVMMSLKETKLPEGRKCQKLSYLNKAEKNLRRKLQNTQNSKSLRDRKKRETDYLKKEIKTWNSARNELKVSVIHIQNRY